MNSRDVLQVNNPEAAIEDATALIAATEGKAAQGSKQHQRLLEKAMKRCVTTAEMTGGHSGVTCLSRTCRRATHGYLRRYL